MPTITVKMLGKFEFCADGQPVFSSLSGSRKAMAVLQYLLLQKGEKVSHQILIDAIWHQESAGNPDMALRAILHRIRKAAQAEGVPVLERCILTSRGSYQWNPGIDCTTDVEQLLACATQASFAKSEAQRSKQCARIVALYKGRLLPTQSGEAWVEGRSVRLQGIYRNALLQQIDQMKAQNLQPQLENLCRKALELNAYDERLYLELIMALEKQNKREEAQQVARTGSTLGCLHRDLNPLRADLACTNIGRFDKESQGQLKQIREDLQSACGYGANQCSYVTFRELYAVQHSIQERNGIPLFLALVTLVAHHEEAPGELEEAMAQLAQLLNNQLRQSDTFAQYGANQFVVTMIGGHIDHSEGLPAPLERVKVAFYQTPAGNDFHMGYCQATADEVTAK